MPTSNTVDEAAGLIRQRLRELDSERAQLQRALSSLTGKMAARAVAAPGARRARRRRRANGRKRGRRAGTRSDQAVKLIKANPGISASEIAKRMSIKPNYLYRVLGELQSEGRVKKDGRSYTAA